MDNTYNIKLLKAAGYDIDGAVKELGSIELYNEILSDFYSETLDRIKRVIAYKKIGNLVGYATEVHAMKAECMYLGINELAKICETHQFKCEEGNVAFINSEYDNFMTEVAKVLTVIKNYLGK